MCDLRRIADHPALGPAAAAGRVAFTYDGRPVEAWTGDTVASALWAAGVHTLGPAPGGGGRGLACGIGHCFACRVTVDGVCGIRACLVPVRAGMRVASEPETEEWHAG